MTHKETTLFSPRNMVILLAVAIAVLAYQTVVLASMSMKLQETGINFSNSSPTTINTTDTGSGSAPSMVGGC